jgi:hypothetical protein
VKSLALIQAALAMSVTNSRASIHHYDSEAGSTGGGSAGAISSFYSISTATGADTFLTTINDVVYTDLASSPIQSSLYAVDEANRLDCLRRFNVVAMTDSLVGCAGTFLEKIGYDAPHNILYGTDDASLYSIVQSNGAATPLGSNGPLLSRFPKTDLDVKPILTGLVH